MLTIQISDQLAQRVQSISDRQQSSLSEVVEAALEDYFADVEAAETLMASENPLAGLVGLLDGVTDDDDLSVTVRETLAKNTHPDYGWTRNDRTD